MSGSLWLSVYKNGINCYGDVVVGHSIMILTSQKIIQHLSQLAPLLSQRRRIPDHLPRPVAANEKWRGARKFMTGRQLRQGAKPGITTGSTGAIRL